MNIWQKKIPGLLGLLLIIIGIGATSFLVQSGVRLFSHASPSEIPQDYRITNISDTSFTVTYKTEIPTIGTISFGQATPTEQVILDDRDQPTGKPLAYSIHSITVRNLHPLTSYVFTITSGSDTYLNNDKPFTVTTGPVITAQPLNQNPLAGTVVLPDGTKPSEGIVILTSPNSQLISALIKSNGQYVLPVNILRTNDLSAYITLAPEQTAQLIAFDSIRISHVIVPVSLTTLPIITLGSDYDFSENSTSPLASAEAQNIETKFPKFAVDTHVNVTVKITTPASGETFTDQQPEFSGTANPNSSVTIEIHSSDVVDATVTTNALGNWTYRPDTPLTPGNHTITITTKDQNGILKTITSAFTIFASGTQVAEAATPSATLAPTASPTPTQTPAITTTVSPTSSVSPTNVITPTQVIQTLTPTRRLTPQPTSSALPPTGSQDTVVFGALGVATTLIGMILFVATKTLPL